MNEPSKTPLTDAIYPPDLLEQGYQEHGESWGWGTLKAMRDCARTLETELNAANARIAELEQVPLLEYEQLRMAARHVLDQFTPQHIDAVSGTNVGSKLIESLTALNTAMREKGIEI